MAGLKKNSAVGLAPYGPRHGSMSAKGKGYFGELETSNGSTATELSSESDDIGEYPLIVPTLNKEELDQLRAGKEPTEAMYVKAETHAKARKESGKSPFAGSGELRYPTPKMKKGGMVKAKPTQSRGDGLAQRGKTKGKMR